VGICPYFQSEGYKLTEINPKTEPKNESAPRGWGGRRAGSGRKKKPKPPAPPTAADRFAALFADLPDNAIIADDDAGAIVDAPATVEDGI
jgi:hypothetical protein